MERAALDERLQIAHFRADGARGDVGLHDHERAFGGVEHVVTRVADDRAGERGQPDLRKQPVDQRQLLGVGELTSKILVRSQ